jgi:hypothetical protein
MTLYPLFKIQASLKEKSHIWLPQLNSESKYVCLFLKVAMGDTQESKMQEGTGNWG